MNVVDLTAAILAALAAMRGWRLGLLGQAFELGGGFLGLVAGFALGPRIASAFTNKPGLQGALISLITLFALVSIGQTIGYILGRRFRAFAWRARLSGLDSGLGAALGVGLTVVSFWLIGTLLVQVPARAVAREVRRSKLLQAVDDALPPPPNLLAYIRQYLDTTGFPQVFVGLPPALGEPVNLPSQAEARKAIDAVRASTVRVVVPACGGMQLGSGWVAATDTVVTNAHVVAGGDGVTVQQPDGQNVPGVVVLFDPRTDVAVVHADVTSPVLPLGTERLERGAQGATLGYPGSRAGQLVARRAAVQGAYEAVGRDIYGRETVTRDIYELRSPVRQGDSGGPFALPTGQVAGVVFAASTTSGDIGYALTGSEVADEVARGSGRASAVSTGSCTH